MTFDTLIVLRSPVCRLLQIGLLIIDADYLPLTNVSKYVSWDEIQEIHMYLIFRERNSVEEAKESARRIVEKAMEQAGRESSKEDSGGH